MSAEILLTPELHSWLGRILRSGEGLLSKPKLKTLMVLDRLAQGQTVAQIASAMRLKKPSVFQIRAKLRAADLRELLTDADWLIEEAQVARARPRRTRGRPGYESFDQWADGIGIAEEPVFDVASIIVMPNAALVVFAVKDPVGMADAFTAELWRADQIAVVWSCASGFDFYIKATFEELRTEVPRITESGSTLDAIRITPIHQRFDDAYHFVSLAAGPKDICDRLLAQLEVAPKKIESYRHNSPRSFLEELESSIFRLRQKRSCIGLLPCWFELYNEVNGLGEELEPRPFVWENTAALVKEWLSRRAVVQAYFAAQGFLLESNRHLWSKLPFQDECDFQTVQVRPKVETVEGSAAADIVRLRVEPLPEIHHFVDVKWQGSPEAIAGAVREQLKRERPTARRRYSTRLPDEVTLRSSIFLPNTYFAKPGDVSKESSIGVVVLPRHTFSPPLPIDLETLAEVAKYGSGIFSAPLQIRLTPLSERLRDFQRAGESAFSKFERSVNEPGAAANSGASDDSALSPVLWIFHSDALASALMEAVGSKRYAYEIAKLRAWQSELIETSARDDRDTACEWMINFMGLSWCISNYVDADAESELVEARARRVQSTYAGGKQTLVEASNREYRRRISEDILWGRLPPGSERGVSESEATLRRLLRDFDADFLLRHLAPERRVQVNADAHAWCETIRAILVREFWDSTGGRLNQEKVHRLFRGERKSWKTDPETLAEVCSELLNMFVSRRVRIIRTAIENAQRCALVGLHPYPIAAEYEHSILRSWRSFVGWSINKRFPCSETLDARDPDLVDSVSQDVQSGYSDAETANASDEDVRVIEAGIAAAFETPTLESFAAFHHVVAETNEIDWRAALEGHDDTWIKAVGAAYKLCKTEAEPTDRNFVRMFREIVKQATLTLP
jgi:hypothetical protein